MAIFLLDKYFCVLRLCKVKLVTEVGGDPESPFSIATTQRCRGELPLSLDCSHLPLILVVLNVKQGGIKYHF